MKLRTALGLVAAGLAACAELAPTTLTWSEIASRPLPPAPAKTAYGSDPQQFGELRLPPGRGPFPVAMLVHGGCWLAQFDYRYFTHLADTLSRMGVASWTVEYRRIGNPGGGWPGTFDDVAAAAGQLALLARTQPLDLSRLIVIGHSAGGQLGLWLAARKEPPVFSGVIGLAPITDLARYAQQQDCGEAVVPLMGGAREQQAARYQKTSPAERLPLGVRQRLVAGEIDRIVPLAMVQDYAAAARKAGDDVSLSVVPGAGHFDLITEDGAGWPALRAAVVELLGLKPG